MMPDSVSRFYDQLADDYHLIFINWKQSVLRQADILDALIRKEKGAPPLTALDCSCGIGTQAIGLALKGYLVHATDISPIAVERASHEAEKFSVSFTTAVADLRTLDTQVTGTFDVVISFDNALPHLLTDADLLKATRGMASKLASGGLLLASIRDYDHLSQEQSRATQPQLYDDEQGRRVVFQVWEWRDNTPLYTLHHFILREVDGLWQTTHRSTPYRALKRAELTTALEQAGLSDIRWHMPDETGHYQPVMTARKG